MKDSVTVVTITRHRPPLLRRCMESVRNQDFRGTLRHLIVVDDCPQTLNWLSESLPQNSNLRYLLAPRTPEEHSGPPRLAKLRNYAHKLVDATWTALLDDDNEWESHHVSSLLGCAIEAGCDVVHSHRQLFRADGTPFLEQRMPWCRDPRQAETRYWELVERGVLEVGSNIMKDRVDPNSDKSGIRIADTSEWLVKTAVLRGIRIPEEFTYQDWLDNLAEDDRLLEALGDGRRIACTRLPTLKYYLGGYSNDFDESSGHSERWIFRNGTAK